MAQAVKYGRRKGQTRGSPTELAGKQAYDHNLSSGKGATTNLPMGMTLPDGTDLRQVTILSKNDWTRIQDQLSRTSKEAERIQAIKTEKDNLHGRSKEAVKNWSNTIAGQRVKKLQSRKLREEEEEKERVQIDIEEAKYQAKQRKEAIEKAKTQQYYQTDRVKGFHEALLLTEVLKERDIQVEMKKARERANIGKDKELVARYQRELEMGILEDQQKALNAMDERRKISEFQHSQIQEHLKVKVESKAMDILEGEDIKKNVERYMAEKSKIDDIRLLERMDLMNAHKQTVKNRDVIRAIEKQKEEEEEEEIRQFAAAKRKMAKLRKQRENELWQEKQDHCDRMIELLSNQLKQKVDSEDDRISWAIKERETKFEKDEKLKSERLARELQEISEHRISQMKKNEQKIKKEKEKEIELLSLKKEADKVFEAQQQEKTQAKRDVTRGLQKFHVQQIDERNQKEIIMRKDELEHEKCNLDLMALEELQFQKYAKKVIDHYKKTDSNVYPLVKAAREGHGGGQGPVFEGKGGVRPSYLVQDGTGVELPNFQRDSAKDVKKMNDSGNSNKRLGFVW